MSRPIATAVRSPQASALLLQLCAALPPEAAVFLVVVGPVDERGGREIVLGGNIDQEEERRAALSVLDPATAHETLEGKRRLGGNLN